MKKLAYSILLSGLVLSSCTKNLDEITSRENGKNVSEKYFDTRINCDSQNYLFEMVKDNSTSNEELTKNILEVGLVCQNLLKTLIQDKERFLDQRNLKIILIYNSPLEDEVLNELLNNTKLSKKLIEKVLAHNLPISQHIKKQINNLRPDIIIPKKDIDYETWLDKNINRIDQISLSEIQEFENKDIQKKIFNILPIKRKKAIWLKKMDQFISLNLCNTNEKIDCINKLKKIIKKCNFTTNTNGVPNNHLELQKIKEITRISFEGYNTAILLQELNDYNEPFTSRIGIGPIKSYPDCDCSTQSDYCAGILDQIPNAACAATKCSGSLGCGTLWVYDCVGICRFTF